MVGVPGHGDVQRAGRRGARIEHDERAAGDVAVPVGLLQAAEPRGRAVDGGRVDRRLRVDDGRRRGGGGGRGAHGGGREHEGQAGEHAGAEPGGVVRGGGHAEGNGRYRERLRELVTAARRREVARTGNRRAPAM